MPNPPIKARYNRLNEMDKAILRDLFTEVFGTNHQAFYRVIKRTNIAPTHIEFFSKQFGVPINDLVNELLQSDDRFCQQVADEVGLSKPA